MNQFPEHSGLAGRLARAFVHSKLTPLLVVSAILLGSLATLRLPREEEPQIKVPMIDIFVAMPGASAGEIERRVTSPMERILWEVPGVEYVYSTSSPGFSMVVTRFTVGEDVESALVRLTSRLQSQFDRIPPGVSFPLIKPRSIDDVPILALTFSSQRYDHLDLRRVAAEVQERIAAVPEVAESQLIGGARRQVRVELDPSALAGRNLSPGAIAQALMQTNAQYQSGALTADDRAVLVATGGFFRDLAEVRQAVVGVHQGKPVRLCEVASVRDGAEELSQYVFTMSGQGVREPAVTLTVAKRPGANAIAVAERVLARVDELRGDLIPAEVITTITRHYGETASEKSNELLLHMGIAVASVCLLILFMLGAREALIVLIAVPATLALTLMVFQLAGYTLNRITLFALIFSIGILVDDAIVVVENIVRHRRLTPERPLPDLAVAATAEVGNPTILATLAVIAAILPMAGVGGLMGPYMRPIPVGASAAMVWSLLIAFIVTPWAAAWLLKGGSQGHGGVEVREAWFLRAYRGWMGMLFHRGGVRWGFLAVLAVLILASMALVGLRVVEVKMLPFDNKSEFQVIINLPEGTSLERTAALAQDLAERIRQEPEVSSIQSYAGCASPFNFNGLVRHYYLRRGDHVADLQVNLLGKHARAAQSHEIAKRVRNAILPIAQRAGARITVAEVPPGPPVLQTLVAEVFAPTSEHRQALADEIKAVFSRTAGVVDVDWYEPAAQPRLRYVPDEAKAALHGISVKAIADTLHLAASGLRAGLLHQDAEKEDVELMLQFPRSARSHPEDLLAIRMNAADGHLVPLVELVQIRSEIRERDIYHKNLQPVAYVVGDVAGVVEAPVYAIQAMNTELAKIDATRFGGSTKVLQVLNASQPQSILEPAIKWDGEWHITIEVFRDLGLAFAAVIVLIYLLMVGWFKSFITPLVVISAIPVTLIGVLPAHGFFGVFFSATSMIGFMAGAGIVVRNSIILVDFIEERLAEGKPLAEAAIEAGAVRFRPILLTALAVVVGAAVILFDPIFQGLAIALMAGEVVSMLVSPVAVPLLYVMVARADHRAEVPHG